MRVMSFSSNFNSQLPTQSKQNSSHQPHATMPSTAPLFGGVTRRTVLSAVGAGAVAALTGCDGESKVGQDGEMRASKASYTIPTGRQKTPALPVRIIAGASLIKDVGAKGKKIQGGLLHDQLQQGVNALNDAINAANAQLEQAGSKTRFPSLEELARQGYFLEATVQYGDQPFIQKTKGANVAVEETPEGFIVPAQPYTFTFSGNIHGVWSDVTVVLKQKQ